MTQITEKSLKAEIRQCKMDEVRLKRELKEKESNRKAFENALNACGVKVTEIDNSLRPGMGELNTDRTINFDHVEQVKTVLGEAGGELPRNELEILSEVPSGSMSHVLAYLVREGLAKQTNAPARRNTKWAKK